MTQELYTKIINCETGEIEERLMTPDEVNAYNETIISMETAKAEQAASEEAKAAEKAALLERLGITQEEAQLLLG
jgi:hypothetical protein